MRILISLTIWAKWKTRNRSAISDQDIAPTETGEYLKELISDLIRKSRNATRLWKAVEGWFASTTFALYRPTRGLWILTSKRVLLPTSLNEMWPGPPA